MKTRAIGEVFQLKDGTWVEVTEALGCNSCHFDEGGVCNGSHFVRGECVGWRRTDNIYVDFAETDAPEDKGELS